MEFATVERSPETVLVFAGALDARSSGKVRRMIDRVVGERRRQVKLDLSSLDMIDGSGVGAIVSLYKRVREYGGDVEVTGLRDQPAAIFRLVGLDRIFATRTDSYPRAARTSSGTGSFSRLLPSFAGFYHSLRQRRGEA